MPVKEKPVLFDPIEHRYSTRDTNETLRSCTQFIHLWKPEFDATGEITAKYADKHGLTVDEVKEKWKIINEEACTYGTAVHEELEYFINTGEIRDSDYSKIVEQFSKFNFEGKLFSEVMVYSLDLMIAGTVDLIEKLDKVNINIYDFKTNKKLLKKNPWRTKMLHGLWYMDDCNFNHYTLQLSLYGYLCELKGLKVNKLMIYYINPKTKLIESHDIVYKINEIKSMLNEYKIILN